MEDKLGVLIARGLVTPASSRQIRILNVSNQLVNLKAGMKVGDLLPIETTEKQMCLTIVTEEQQKQSISEIIDISLKNEASTLTVNKKQKLAKLLKYEAIISRGSTDIGSCKLLTHRIDTGDTSPIRMAPRRIPYFQKEEVQQDISAKEAAGIVKKSTSPWAFPIVGVRKQDGTA